MYINMSDQLNHLFNALSKVQAKLESVNKDKTGFNGNYKYADLSQYLCISKDILSEYGLSIIQIPGEIEVVEVTKEIFDKKNQCYNFHNIRTPKQRITNIICHDSGQFISGNMEIIVEKMAANSWGQSTGSAITYARRYAYSGLLNMAQEDNDNQYSKEDVDKKYNIQKISSTQVSYFNLLLADDQERMKKILSWANISKLEDMSIETYNKAIEILQKENQKEISSANKDTNCVSNIQIDFIKKLITPDRLDKILKEYKIQKLEEIKRNDYNKLYDQLRLEMVTDNINENLSHVN